MNLDLNKTDTLKTDIWLPFQRTEQKKKDKGRKIFLLLPLRSCFKTSASTITHRPPTGGPAQHSTTQRPGTDRQPKLPLQWPAAALEV